jgi:hypothetical protein
VRVLPLSDHSFSVLVNEGLEPGVRVVLDDDVEATGTLCSTESGAPYAVIRLDRGGQRQRVASWRLACVE